MGESHWHRGSFPTIPGSAAFFSAAWNAYVVFNRAYIAVFEILRESYDLAVERFEEVDEERYIAGNPREHLGRAPLLPALQQTRST